MKKKEIKKTILKEIKETSPKLVIIEDFFIRNF